MARLITHSTIINLHQTIASAHVDIFGFYRFDISEIQGSFREGIVSPALLLESHSSDLESKTKMATNFNNRNISFLLIDFVKDRNNFDEQNQVLDAMENIGLDIASYLVKESKDTTSILYSLFDVNTFSMEKVGPIFDNMYGWNVLYTLRNHEKMCFDPVKWQF
jgi:hypothetical protein